jgi:hypothetical protein
MPGGLMNGALPIGMIMCVGMVLAVVYRRLGRRKAARRFPDLAQRLGLTHVPPLDPAGVGRLSGRYQGRSVLVDPDEQRLIAVRFEGAPRVDLRSYEASLRPPFDMVTVYSGDRFFDRFFKTRFASEEIAARIADSDHPSTHLNALHGRFYRQVKSLAVTAEGVMCRVDFGSPPYIPSAALEQLLPACVAIADLVEPMGADSPNETPRSERQVQQGASR